MTEQLPRRVDGIAGLEALVGVELGPSAPLVVDEATVRAFADATGDHQWIHLDAERAKREGPWGGPIAHGYLVLSLVPQMLFRRLVLVEGVKAVINYGIDKLRFPDVTRVGSALTLRAKLAEIVDKPAGKLARFEVAFSAEGSPKPCCVAEILVMFTG
jgi:acyl dehydratase